MKTFILLILLPCVCAFDWTQLSTSGSTPSARRRHTAVLYGSDMVIFGGDDGSEKNDAYKLDLQTNTWTQLSTSGSTPSALGEHTAVLYGNSTDQGS